MVCNRGSGCLKRIVGTETPQWVHISCGIFSQGTVQVSDYQRMDFILNPDYQAPQAPQREVCTICSQGGELEKCLHQDCEHYIHISCCLEQKPNQSEEEELDRQNLLENWLILYFQIHEKKENKIKNFRFPVNTKDKAFLDKFEQVASKATGRAICRER